MPFIAIALVIAAALGGGTAALAQNSLPGNPLWDFKVNVNESVQGALATSDTAKADWDLNAIEARIAEAKALNEKGTLDASAQTELSANIKDHAAGVENVIAKLQMDGDMQDANDIATRYQADLAGAPLALNASVQGELESATSLLAGVAASIH